MVADDQGTAAGTEPTQIWRWTFRSIAELRKALEEYTAMLDLMLAPPSGKPPADQSDLIDATTMDTVYRIMAQNREIDARMVRLGARAPLYARLLDTYYRKGLSCEAEGWRIVAKRCGLPSEIKVHRGRDVTRPQFDLVLDLALSTLFFCR